MIETPGELDIIRNQIKLNLITVVIPVYGCAECLEILCLRICHVISNLKIPYEIILVDDGSKDDGWEVIEKIADTSELIRGIKLSRNFGQHIAITAGLESARGDYVVVMDCDLQEPPELIPSLLIKLTTGFDYVMGRRVQRSVGPTRIFASKLYFYLFNKLNSTNIDPACGTYAILSRPVVDAILKLGDRERHFHFLLSWIGFKPGFVDYEQSKRFKGVSSYKFWPLVKHAINGLLIQSSKLLHAVIFLGLSIGLLSILLGIFLIYNFFYNGAVVGWTSLAVALLFCTSLIMVSLGIIAIYIGKVFDQTKPRPLYIVASTSYGK